MFSQPGSAQFDSGITDFPLTSGGYDLNIGGTPTIGREGELAQLGILLRQPNIRLVTLTGPGGVGKTRIARETASRGESSGKQVLFVSLSSIADADLVAPAIGQATGLSGADASTLPDRLAAVLGDRQVLLVLDNFEQILPAAPLLSTILGACPTLQMLVTSRSPLHLSIERDFPVAPLGLPDAGSSAEQSLQSPAVRLFIARTGLQNLEPTAQDSSSIAAICRRLDGLPLAIELAAPKLRIMSPVEMLDRMDRALPLLEGGPRDVPARLQTMRNAIAWSYDLLSTDAQVLFRALSVFQGGFSLAAAEGIVPEMPASPVPSLFQELVDSSLIYRAGSSTDSPRFSMLETVREFGLEVLKSRGEEQSSRDRHLSWVSHQLKDQSTDVMYGLLGTPHVDLPDEQDNLRGALSWSLDHGTSEQAARIAYGLVPYWRKFGLYPEAASTLERVLSTSESLETEIIAGLNLRAGTFAYLVADFPGTQVHLMRALQLSRSLGLSDGVRHSLTWLGLATRWSGSPSSLEYLTEAIEGTGAWENKRSLANALTQRGISRIVHREFLLAQQDFNESLRIFSMLPDERSAGSMTLAALGWVAGHQHDIASAERLARKSLSINQEMTNFESWSFARRVLGEVAMTRGDYPEAAAQLTAALQLTHRTGILQIESWCLAQLAALSNLMGDWQLAAHLYGAAQSIWDRLGFSESTRSVMSSWSGRHVPSEDDLAGDAFRLEFDIGLNLPYSDVYAEARAVAPAQLRTGTANPILSPRELEVLQLIARLHTNREIAELLFVSKRTIDGHVVSILTKLNVDSRREAVEVAGKRGLIPGPADSVTPGKERPA